MKDNRTSGNGAGGGRGSGMTAKQPQHFQPMYPEIAESLVDRRAELPAVLAAAARHMLNTCPDLTVKQKQLLMDVERGRYQFKALQALLEIAPSAANPLVLSEGLRAQTLVRLPAQPECLTDALIDETLAQAAADPMQMRFHVERTSALRDATLDKIGPHLVKLQRYSDVLLRWNPTGRRTFA